MRVSRDPGADRVENLEGIRKAAVNGEAAGTPAGSESTARQKWKRRGTWEVHHGLGRADLSIEYADRREDRRDANAVMEVGPADSTRSVGKPRTGGSGGAE